MDSMGFIGAAESLTSAQQAALSELLHVHAPRYFHHGDCLGSDEDAHALAMRGASRVVAHPPTDETQRAHLKAHLILRPVSYLSRFRSIVACSELLIVAMPPMASPLRRDMAELTRRAPMRGVAFLVVEFDGRISKRHGRPNKSARLRLLAAIRRRFRLR